MSYLDDDIAFNNAETFLQALHFDARTITTAALNRIEELIVVAEGWNCQRDRRERRIHPDDYARLLRLRSNLRAVQRDLPRAPNRKGKGQR